MTSLKSLAANRWFWRVLGALVLGLLIWFVGPLIAIGGWMPLGWWPVTLFFALLPVVLVGFFWWWGRRQAARKNAQLVDALAPPPAGDRPELEAKLSEALGMLRATKVGKRGAYLYQLPWYAIIGPSGAGKTTALLNSGLGFPTAVAGEYRALRGQPNTPNCDWWFTDEAVLIDTAGRYVTQEAGSQDAEGWRGFLDLLKRHRPLQPLNGVLVAIPAPDFADRAKMAGHAEHIRARLSEIATTLGQDLPVYLLITKADLLAGFREYFARNTDAESDQVFGSTAPGSGSGDAAVLEGFDGLVTSVSGRVVDRMQNEAQLPLRGQIAAFPAQLASLRKPIADLLAALGQKTRFEGAARVRGIYLTSGTQTGNPVDRILMTVGVPATAAAHAVGKGRSYFLKRLFSDLIFPEQGLAGRNLAAGKRQRTAYVGGLAAGVAALVAAIGLWGWGYARNRALINSVYATNSAYAEAAGTARGGSATPPEDLAALDVLGNATAAMGKASDFGLGLGQGGRLEGELRAIYGRDLNRRLTPMLAKLAEDRMAADQAAPAALYDDLKSYLVLGGRGPLTAEHLLSWVQPAWIGRSGESDAEVQAGNVARHTQALLAGSFQPVAVDAARIEQARGVIRAQPAAVRVYGRLKSEAIAKGGAMWSARDNAGPQPEVFFAPGGAFAPGAGVPGLFTRAGYDKTFLPILASGPALLKEEKWVVGDTGGQAAMSPADMGALKRDLERLYFDEFLTRWRAYFAGMQPKPVASLAENIQRLRDGSGPLSPLPPLMRAIAVATDMSRKGPAPAAPGGLAGKLLGAAGVTAGPTVDDPRVNVERAFLPLRMFVGMQPGGGAPAPGTAAPIDGVLTAMGQLADKLNVVSVLPGGGAEGQGSAASLEVRALVAQLDQSGATMPAPAGIWVKSVASDASVALGGARTAQVGAALSANFGEACKQVLARSFPLQPAAQTEIGVADFARFFGPQGSFAKFVSQDLNGYVDTSKPEWVALPNASEIGVAQADVNAFQAAQGVTRAFFAADPQAPRLVYQIEPVALAGAKSVILRVDGQTLSFDGKAAVPATFDWPGAGGANVEFAIEGSTAPEVRTWPGTWAVFRMMKAAAVKTTGTPITGAGSLTQGGARFDFRVRTFGGSNPFVVDPFAKVACPARTTTPPAA
ncbi:type VI secretion system membrane subunit TssM [Sphingomonas profundi]|uniref:type VI secretion system membrane subunit TssM n=1 Tax=Alterirhizorhabdus profundi TaxID=2681549 RepID=UPI0012E8665A|nr:type VI secretion system membrane subunit TssM [Sphingomonas profundi]